VFGKTLLKGKAPFFLPLQFYTKDFTLPPIDQPVKEGRIITFAMENRMVTKETTVSASVFSDAILETRIIVKPVTSNQSKTYANALISKTARFGSGSFLFLFLILNTIYVIIGIT
jgi:hypothetical protein